jgi:hypothetical protein
MFAESHSLKKMYVRVLLSSFFDKMFYNTSEHTKWIIEQRLLDCD